MAKTLITSDEAFDREIFLSDVPVIAEFARGEAGGGTLGGLTARMDREYAGRARFIAVDLDACGDVATRYAIRSDWALLAFEDGAFRGYITAADTKAEIWRWIERSVDVEPSCGVALSVRAEYALAVAAGDKRVEFRRKRMHAPVSHAIFYAAAPAKRLVCLCEAFWLDWTDLEALWARWGDKGGVSREEFDAYYEGCEEGLAIELANPRAFKAGVELSDIGLRQAPQGYRYVDRMALERIFGLLDDCMSADVRVAGGEGGAGLDADNGDAG